MATMPTPVAELLDRALVGELTVIDANDRPVTYPLIPLYDGERVYMTSSTSPSSPSGPATRWSTCRAA